MNDGIAGPEFDLAHLLPDALAAFVPSDAYSLSQYNYRAPAAAWEGFQRGLAGQVDAVSALLLTRLLPLAFQPYGITEPSAFLATLGPVTATARLNDAEGGTVIIAKVNDETALRALVPQLLGGAPGPPEQVPGADIFTDGTPDGRAAAFTGGYLLLGPAERVRRCLEARKQGATLAQNPAWRRAADTVTPTPQAVSYTDEQAAARAFLAFVATRNATGKPQPVALSQALARLPYAVSETRLTNDALEKQTRSAFGLIGTLAAQFRTEELSGLTQKNKEINAETRRRSGAE